MSVYLDHNATSPLHPEVSRIMGDIGMRGPGNPSSIHTPGQGARRTVDAARNVLRDLVGGPGGDIVFTGSGTEAVLLGVVGGALAASDRGRHAVVSRVEHLAGLDAADLLIHQGWDVSWVSPDASGVVSPGSVADALTSNTTLVSVMHANNETGVIQPVGDIAAVCREHGVLYHVDAVQSVGKIPVTAELWGADLVSIAAHKMGGPAGTGALWKRSGVPVRSLIPGAQEQGLRGGTHNCSLLGGFAEAARQAGTGLETAAARISEVRKHLEDTLEREVPQARITGAQAPRLPNTTHLTLDPSVGPDLVMALDMAGFAVSAGSACRAGSTDPSHVLTAMGLEASRARTAVRVSLGPENTTQEMDAFVHALARCAESVRSAGSPS